MKIHQYIKICVFHDHNNISYIVHTHEKVKIHIHTVRFIADTKIGRFVWALLFASLKETGADVSLIWDLWALNRH